MQLYAPRSIGEQQQRYQQLGDALHKLCGQTPSFYVRAPGRVNLIGEHIDYHNYTASHSMQPPGATRALYNVLMRARSAARARGVRLDRSCPWR